MAFSIRLNPYLSILAVHFQEPQWHADRLGDLHGWLDHSGQRYPQRLGPLTVWQDPRCRIALDHRGLWRRWQLHYQHIAHAQPGRQPGWGPPRLARQSTRQSRQSVTFTATVTAASPGSGTPTGSVTFMDGSTALGSATLGSGKASFKTTSLAVGSQAITAVYGGDGNFTTSTSTALTQTVQEDATATKLTSSVNLSVFGQSVTFTATVEAASPGSGTPSGTVTFYDGSTAIGVGTLGLGNRTPPRSRRSASRSVLTRSRRSTAAMATSARAPRRRSTRESTRPVARRRSSRRPIPLHPVRRSRSRLRSTRSHRAVGRQLGPSRSTKAQPRWARPRSMDRHGELHNLVPLGRLTFDQGVLWRRRRFQGEHLGGSQAGGLGRCQQCHDSLGEFSERPGHHRASR